MSDKKKAKVKVGKEQVTPDMLKSMKEAMDAMRGMMGSVKANIFKTGPELWIAAALASLAGGRSATEAAVNADIFLMELQKRSAGGGGGDSEEEEAEDTEEDEDGEDEEDEEESEDDDEDEEEEDAEEDDEEEESDEDEEDDEDDAEEEQEAKSAPEAGPGEKVSDKAPIRRPPPRKAPRTGD